MQFTVLAYGFNYSKQHNNAFNLHKIAKILVKSQKYGRYYQNACIYGWLSHTGTQNGQSLWDWLMAALPEAKFCLASATLTDNAVKDITSSQSQNLFWVHLSPPAISHTEQYIVCWRFTWAIEEKCYYPLQEACQARNSSSGFSRASIKCFAPVSMNVP